MKQIISILFFALFFPVIVLAQDTLLAEGSYEGKNLYIQNPFAENGKGFCTQKVLVNSVPIDFEQASAFEINLSALNLKTGDKVKVEIIHAPGCAPKILHPEMRCHPICPYSILSIQIEHDSMLTWTSTERNGKFMYSVEQYRWNKWVKLGEVECKSGFDTASYAFGLTKYFTPGQNKFRVKVVDYVKNVYSPPVVIEKPADLQPFEIQDAAYYHKNPIEFHNETLWEIYDMNGNVMKKGYGKTAEVKELRRGTYFLCFDNSIIQISL